MKWLEAKKCYEDLNSDQKEFMRNPKKVFKNRADKTLKFLGPVAEASEKITDAKDFFAKLALFSLIFSIILILFGIDFPIISWPLSLLFLAVFGYSLYMNFFYKKMLIHSNMKDFVLPVFSVISHDVPKNNKIELGLDLKGPFEQDKMVDSRDSGFFSSEPSIKRYKDAWFFLKAQLIDGTNIEVNVENDVQKIVIVKTSASGKRKAKTKYKVKQLINVDLSLNNKKYRITQTPEDEKKCIKAKIKSDEEKSKIRLKAAVKSNDTNDSLAPEACLNLIANAFMNLKPAK